MLLLQVGDAELSIAGLAGSCKYTKEMKDSFMRYLDGTLLGSGYGEVSRTLHKRAFGAIPWNDFFARTTYHHRFSPSANRQNFHLCPPLQVDTSEGGSLNGTVVAGEAATSRRSYH